MIPRNDLDFLFPILWLLPVFEQTIIIPGITKDNNVESKVTEGGNEAIQSVLLKLSFESIIWSI